MTSQSAATAAMSAWQARPYPRRGSETTRRPGRPGALCRGVGASVVDYQHLIDHSAGNGVDHIADRLLLVQGGDDDGDPCDLGAG